MTVVLLLCVSLAACTDQAAQPPAVAPVNEAAVLAEATPQPADMVDLAIYFRHGNGPRAHLEPVKREVKLSDDLPRAALTMLLNGPSKSDPPNLRPPLPTTTRVVSFSLRKGTANVTLSREAVADAAQVGKRPEHEAIALAAVANTLTEFPDVTRVRLRVEGARDNKLWGGWGIPPVLVRDDSIVEPVGHEAFVPPLDRFSHRPQQVGVRDDRRPPTVAAVRVQSRSTYVRVTVEVTAASGGDLRGPVPPTLARHVLPPASRNSAKNKLKPGKGKDQATQRKTVALIVRARPARDLGGELHHKFADPSVKAARVSVRGKARHVVIRVRQRHRSQFWLHTLSKPARVVLDIRR